MDIWEIVMIILGVILISYLCNYCCGTKNRQGRVLGAPVVITTTTTSGGGYPGGGFQPTPTPYPTTMPMPDVNPQYPTHPGVQPMPQPTPYPPAPGFQSHAIPYPPLRVPLANQNPPSYDQVVGTEAIGGKQAPYNPHYMGN